MIGDEPTEEQRELLGKLAEHLHGPAGRARADQLGKLREEVIDDAITMFVEGYELQHNGDTEAAVFHVAKYYGWIKDLDEESKYQLIIGLIQNLLDLTLHMTGDSNYIELRDRVDRETREEAEKEGLPPL